ncbi:MULTISPECIES: hypothetical protein [unclassified Erwinia]|uniref:hypothetical protein n=1 Tax=unclassified Erwinia TaxID=2622719 RepID=UPI00082D2A4E|nr:hypothetical protein [Erwinia sp. ErVv1]
MRELTLSEINNVGGGSLSGPELLGIGGAGLIVGIPIIVGGAILGVPTLGLGFVGMTAGIVLTALSGAMMIVGIVKTAISCKPHPIKPEPEPAAF